MLQVRSVGAASLAIVAACANAKSKPKDAPPPLDSPGVDAAVTSWRGTVQDYETSAGIGGAIVCIPGHTEIACTTTDPTGGYSLGIPMAASTLNLPVAITASGYLGAVVLGQGMGSARALPGVVLLADAVANTLLGSDAGFNATDTTTGFLEVTLDAPNRTGATGSITPASGMGPVYGNGSGFPQQGLTSTAATGQIYFGNVTPGVVSVTVALSGKTCTASAGSGSGELVGDWPPTGSGTTVAAQVVSGAMTEGVNVSCQ